MLRSRHATVVAYLALFVALGGTSVAAVKLSRNSVKSSHIKNGQVKRVDLAAGLRGPGLPGAPGAQGERGPQGERGLSGADGADGTDGAAGPQAVKIRINGSGTVAITPEWSVELVCDYSGSTNDLNMQIRSHSTGTDRNLGAAWTQGPRTGGAQSPLASAQSTAADVTPISHTGSGDDQVQWNGQFVHSSTSGTATVVFHAFTSFGGCHMSGVGTVAG